LADTQVMQKEDVMKYLVSHKGQEVGPFTLDEILNHVREKELDLFDYIFDEAAQDWVLLMEHAEVSGRLKSLKPQRPPSALKTETPVSTAKAGKTVAFLHPVSEWFLLKGEHRFGPFSYSDLVKMLQQKAAFPFDFTWHAGMNTWKRIAELEDFQPERIRSLFVQTASKKTAGAEVFAQRKFPRQRFNGRVLIHDNTKLWKGEGFEISQGGVGITMSNALVAPGQQLIVHFKSEEGFPSFNAVCEVVSKKFVNDNSPIQYGLKFLTLSQEVQEEFYKKVA
jgi:hypothetical protein